MRNFLRIYLRIHTASRNDDTNMPIEKLFTNLTESPGAKGALSGAASGAMVSLLMNKKSRKALGKGAVQLGGMAALAGVGYYAYRKWQGSKGGEAGTTVVGTPEPASAQATDAGRSLPPGDSTAPDAPAVSENLGLQMIKAMIAAAYADGAIDDREMQGLFESIEQADLTPTEKAELTAALNQPPTLEAVTAGVTDPESGAEIYGAALMAIDPDTPAEQFFLRRLANGLGLDTQLVEAIHLQVRADSA